MTQITNWETIELDVAVLYGEDAVVVEHPNGNVSRERVDSNQNILTALVVPEPDHLIGLAGLGREQALDALRNGME